MRIPVGGNWCPDGPETNVNVDTTKYLKRRCPCLDVGWSMGKAALHFKPQKNSLTFRLHSASSSGWDSCVRLQERVPHPVPPHGFFLLLVGERILQLAKQLDSGRLQTGNFSRLRSVLGFSVFPVEDRSRPPFLGTDAAHVMLCDEKSGAAATNFRRGCKAIPARLHKEIPVRLRKEVPARVQTPSASSRNGECRNARRRCRGAGRDWR